MFFSNFKYTLVLAGLLVVTNSALRATAFPDLSTLTTFQHDLRRSALITNLPNLPDRDQFIGIGLSLNGLQTGAGRLYTIPSVKLCIYPNPGYSLWARFAYEPAELPRFSVGTGIQVQVPADDPQRRQAVGVSWNQMNTVAYQQRDISLHGLYAYSGVRVELGLMLLIDLQHVLVVDDQGLPDYDATLWQAAPYIGWMLHDNLRTVLHLAFDASNTALQINLEYFLGVRE